VFGNGPVDADLLVLGEAPGEDEDARGEPFVGPAGWALDKLLREAGLDREQAYVTNVVLCRPPKNRRPTSAEIAACSSHLDAQINAVRPRVILGFGATAARRLLGAGARVGTSRGRRHDRDGVRIFITFHPSAWNRKRGRRALVGGDIRLAGRFLSLDASAMR